MGSGAGGSGRGGGGGGVSELTRDEARAELDEMVWDGDNSFESRPRQQVATVERGSTVYVKTGMNAPEGVYRVEGASDSNPWRIRVENVDAGQSGRIRTIDANSSVYRVTAAEAQRYVALRNRVRSL